MPEKKNDLAQYNSGGKPLATLGDKLKDLKGNFPDAKDLKDQPEKQEAKKNDETLTAAQIAEFFVAGEALEEYFSKKVRGGRERKESAVQKLKQDLAKRLDQIKLGDAEAINETAKKFVDSVAKKTKLGEITKKHFKQWNGSLPAEQNLAGFKENSDESSKGPSYDDWRKEPYQKIAEDYLIWKIKDENPDLKEIDDNQIKAAIGRQAEEISKQAGKAALDLDLEGVSFESLNDVQLFIIDQINRNKGSYDSAVSKLGQKADNKSDEEKIGEQTENAPKTIEEFQERFEIGTFYVNKKDASDLTIIDYNPHKKEVTIYLSYKFKEEEPEINPGETEPTSVYSIEQRGGKKIMNFDKFENMMKSYILERKFHENEIREERTKQKEVLGAQYINENGQTLELFEYKKGKKKSKHVGGGGRVGVKIDGGEIQYEAVAKVEKLIEDGDFKLDHQHPDQGKDKSEILNNKEQKTKPQEASNEETERLEFDEREKKMLEVYRKFASAYIEEVETYDYEGEGYLKKSIPREKKRQGERFWEVVLSKTMKQKKSFRNDDLIEKAVEQIRKTEK